MDDSDFDGTIVLERLAAVGKLDGFADAVDSDDIEAASVLMRAGGIDEATIAIVVRKMREG